MKRVWSQAAALLLALGFWTAHAALRPEHGGSLRLALFDVAILDPTQLPLSAQVPLQGLVFETLLVPGARTGDLEAGIAERWKFSEDGLELVIGLRPAFFADGAPLLPQDALDSLRRLNSSSWAWLTQSLDLEHSFGQGPKELHLRLHSADPLLAFKLAHPATALAKPAPQGRLLGSGPFQVAETSADRQLLKSNPFHAQGPPYLDSVELLRFEALATSLRQLELGKLDAGEVPLDQVDRLAEGTPDLKLTRLPQGQTVLLLINAARLKDSMRGWIESRLDLESILSFRLGSHGAIASSLEPMLAPFSGARPTPKPTGASEATGSGPTAPELRLIYPRSQPLAQQLAARLRVDLQDSSRVVVLEAASAEELDSKLGGGDFELALVFISSLGSPPLTLLNWSRLLGQPIPPMDAELASWLAADERLRDSPWVLPLFRIDRHFLSGTRWIGLDWDARSRPFLERTWWNPQLEISPR